MSDEQERQRNERLRKQQLNARNAGGKMPAYMTGQSEREKQRQKERDQRSLLLELYGALGTRYQVMVVGLLLSILPTIAILVTVPGDSRVLAILPPLVFGLGGLLIGSMMKQKTFGKR